MISTSRMKQNKDLQFKVWNLTGILFVYSFNEYPFSALYVLGTVLNTSKQRLDHCPHRAHILRKETENKTNITNEETKQQPECYALRFVFGWAPKLHAVMEMAESSIGDWFIVQYLDWCVSAAPAQD